MQHNLIPPSHFDDDSLNSPSQQPLKEKSNNDVSSDESAFAKNNVLITPNDFTSKRQVDISTSQQPAIINPHVRSKVSRNLQHGCVVSQDSGFEQEVSKTDGVYYRKPTAIPTMLQAFNELKEENQSLKDMITKNLTDKNSNCNYNVITHQVQYIERLQKDVANSADKISKSESELAKMDLRLQERNVKIEENITKIKQLDEELRAEKENASNLTSVIVNLKANLQTSNDNHQILQRDQEMNLSLLKTNHQEEIDKMNRENCKCQEEMHSHFENERRAWEEKFSEEKEQLKLEHEALVLEHQRNIDQKLKAIECEKQMISEQKSALEKEIDATRHDKDNLNAEVVSLSQQLTACQESLEQNKAETVTLHDRLQSEKDAVNQLKSYIVQVQANEHSREKWKEEKEEADAAINILKEEKLEVEKTLEMLKVRFESVSKILEMQEQSITAHTTAISDSTDQSKAAVVTSQWRAKVFELMVHCKTQEIVCRELTSKHQRTVRDLNDQLQEKQRESQILASRLDDVDAQLRLQQHVTGMLEGNNEKLKRDLEAWKKKSDQQHEAISKLRDAVKGVSDTYCRAYEDAMSACLDKCLRMEQRLTFANNRIRAIQDLMKRRDSMWKIRLQRASQDGSRGSGTIEKDEKESTPDLRMEVLQLTEERESLSQQLAHDAAQFERAVKSMKKDEEHYKQTNRNLEKQIIENEEKIEELNSKIDEMARRCDDERYEKDNFASELEQARVATQKEVEAALEEAKQRHHAEMKQHETFLNQVKRDLTKAVVSLRQAERSSVREKNQLLEQLDTERQLHSTEEEKLRGSVRNLQKDNNLLMTTLRQEGLLASVKAARAAPLEARGDEIAPKRVHFEPSPTAPEKQEKSKLTDVDEMLKNLTNLSELVLAPSDSD